MKQDQNFEEAMRSAFAKTEPQPFDKERVAARLQTAKRKTPFVWSKNLGICALALCLCVGGFALGGQLRDPGENPGQIPGQTTAQVSGESGGQTTVGTDTTGTTPQYTFGTTTIAGTWVGTEIFTIPNPQDLLTVGGKVYRQTIERAGTPTDQLLGQATFAQNPDYEGKPVYATNRAGIVCLTDGGRTYLYEYVAPSDGKGGTVNQTLGQWLAEMDYDTADKVDGIRVSRAGGQVVPNENGTLVYRHNTYEITDKATITAILALITDAPTDHAGCEWFKDSYFSYTEGYVALRFCTFGEQGGYQDEAKIVYYPRGFFFDGEFRLNEEQHLALLDLVPDPFQKPAVTQPPRTPDGGTQAPNP